MRSIRVFVVFPICLVAALSCNRLARAETQHHDRGGEEAGAPGLTGDADVDMASILRIALAHNPDLGEEQARIAAARARTRQAVRLPDPQLKYEQWGVPLGRPWALGEAQMLMIGVSQTFPGVGVFDARGRVAAEDERMAVAQEDSRRRDLRVQVRRAFADYYRANREIALHREHAELTAQLVELARAGYRAGQRTQQDVLRLSLELARFHGDIAHLEQEEQSARALLNALMNRPSDAPLGRPAELPAIEAPRPVSVEGDVLERRAEVAAARAAVSRGEAALDLAHREATWPTFMVGLDYANMPTMEDPHAYNAMLSMSLPWLNAGRRDAIRAAEETLTAERRAFESVQNAVRYQVRDARAKHEAASATLAIVDVDLLPEARRNLEAAQAAYAAGRGDAMALVDALRSYLDVDVDRLRGLVHLENTAADLERALAGKEETP